VELPLAQTLENFLPKILHEEKVVRTARKEASAFRILLVEDHEPTRNALHHLLMRRHYEVETAASLAEARLLLAALDFDLLISDIGLPDGSGCDLMNEARKKNLPGIALTGYGMENDVAASHTAGFTTHLIKPVRVQSLEAALAAIQKKSTALLK
jgi:DNA-binding response OmpR family regulator